MSLPLLHYCCAHSRRALGTHGLLLPRPNAVDPRIRVVWLTDLIAPWAEQLGLTSYTLRCDRMEFRYRARGDHGAIPWLDYAASFKDGLREFRQIAEQFTAAPERWFVSPAAVPVELDRAYVCQPANRAISPTPTAGAKE